jgi:protein-L-isoaspartate(D-aspartate) O-methyltransferase
MSERKARGRGLVESLVAGGYLKSPAVTRAFLSIPRERFVPPELGESACLDEPLPIGRGQTISAPHIVAVITELLRPDRRDVVLEVGAGSGYQAAILSRLVGRVYAMELEPELCAFARRNLRASGIRNVEVVEGDGSRGLPGRAPFQRIVMSCAAPSIPGALVSQLAEGGVLVAPVGPAHGPQILTSLEKSPAGLRKTEHFGVAFVPMR